MNGWMEKQDRTGLEWMLDTRGLRWVLECWEFCTKKSVPCPITAHAVLPHDVSGEVDKPLTIKNISY